ncbi:MAG: DUF2523 family protein [Limnobacter sp.]
MLSILFSALSWLVKGTVVKAVAASAIFGLVAVLVPFVTNLILPFISATFLNDAFANTDSGVWFFLDLFRLDFGLPLLISAAVTKFLIRRIPIIG